MPEQHGTQQPTGGKSLAAAAGIRPNSGEHAEPAHYVGSETRKMETALDGPGWFSDGKQSQQARR
jgi:hypothetical protein